MNKIQCPNGHYYDADEFSKCPHCNKFRDDKTIALWPFAEEEPEKGERAVKENWVEKRWQIKEPVGQEEKTLAMYAKHVSNSSNEKTEAIFSNILSPSAQQHHEVAAPTKQKIDEASSEDNQGSTGVSQGTDDTERTRFIVSAPSSAANKGEQKTSQAGQEERSDDPQSQIQDRASDPVVGWLVCVHGKRFGEFFTIGAGKNSIGRTKENRICIEGDLQISKSQHAFVIYEPRSRQFYLQPGNSSGLTYLNQQLVLVPEALKQRDEIGLNNSRFLFIPLCDDTFSWDDCE